MADQVAVNAGEQGFTHAFDPLISRAVGELVGQLADSGLQPSEERALVEGLRDSLLGTLRVRLNRVLIVELHAARLTGRLGAADSAGRWREFEELASTAAFWKQLEITYPALGVRLGRLVTGRVRAAAELGCRLVTDRARLRVLGVDGPLTGVEFGAGDSHQGGRTVARVRFGDGTVMYKPRPLEVDAALADLLDDLQEGSEPRIGVPQVVRGLGYGWTLYVEHRYCEGEEEVRRFYQGMGWLLAVTRLLAASDLHSENIIAHGSMPVVVDCETLFTPVPPASLTPVGGATVRAWDRVSRTVANSLLLPGRTTGPGLNGLDMSALGTLADQQPQVSIPLLVGAGTDEPRLSFKDLDIVAPGQASHPTPRPTPERYASHLLSGFGDGIARIDQLRRTGRLDLALDRFASCQIRVVPRATAHYGELARDLWHPASLRNQTSAVSRITELMITGPGEEGPGFGDGVIAAEIEDLLAGDVPVFTLTPDVGQVTGPNGIVAAKHGNLIAATKRSWQALDPALERYVIKTSLVNAYLNSPALHSATTTSGPLPIPMQQTMTQSAHQVPLEADARALAADLAQQLCRTAIWGEDGTVTWIGVHMDGPVSRVGPLAEDVYGGQAGVALALAAYQYAVRHKAASPIDGLSETLTATARTLGSMEQHWATFMPAGGYIGLGASIWTWLMLDRLANTRAALDQSQAAASRLRKRDLTGEGNDILSGLAGSITPLIALHERTGDASYLRFASRIATELSTRAHYDNDGAYWPDPDHGFAHGSTGIGWALARLSLATGQTKWMDLAHRAFAFDQSDYDPQHGWRDLAATDASYPHNWCRGSVGIGLSHLDLFRRTNRREHLDLALSAADHATAAGLTGCHDLCHGDLGTWELLTGLDSHRSHHGNWTSQMIRSLKTDGPVVGISADASTPSLMTGIGGLVYQLLRMQRGIALPSILVIGG